MLPNQLANLVWGRGFYPCVWVEGEKSGVGVAQMIIIIMIIILSLIWPVYLTLSLSIRPNSMVLNNLSPPKYFNFTFLHFDFMLSKLRDAILPFYSTF